MPKHKNLEIGSINTVNKLTKEKTNWFSIFLIILSGIFLTFSMVLVQIAQKIQPIPVSELNFIRGFLGFLIMLGIWYIIKLKKNTGTSKKTNEKLNTWDSKIPFFIYLIMMMLVAGFTNYLYIDTLRFLNLVSAVALSFMIPLITSILAFLFYKERLGWRRLSAISMGVAGTFLILGPTDINLIGFIIAILYILIAAFGRINTKVLSQRIDPITITLFGSLGVLIVSLLMSTFYYSSYIIPSTYNTIVIVLYVITGLLTFLTLNQAISYAANIASVMVFDYLRIYYMIIVNYLLYSQMIGWLGFIGVVLISIGATYTVYREATLRKSKKLKLLRAPRIFR